ncbi:hypothetical protein DPX16_17859 [Anabarilius grahami]|uniref:Uncharacterized protein n=1 Tax=Anabarilius grahami TaxID=495550 RepID=A0A3N0YHH0_ANAGA|nr:hypothetical protein DPX16_17859 [Anabarilius grahami]
MTGTHVPILDIQLQCGQKLFNVSLWRDEALTELYVGDKVILTHLRPCMLNSGQGKFHSSTYTSVKIPEGQVEDIEVDIIAISEINDTYHFLSSDSFMYIVPEAIFSGNPYVLVDKLPMKLVLKHINCRVIEIRSSEK